MSYGSTVSLTDVDFGSSLTGDGIQTKHAGFARKTPASSGSLVPSVDIHSTLPTVKYISMTQTIRCRVAADSSRPTVMRGCSTTISSRSMARRSYSSGRDALQRRYRSECGTHQDECRERHLGYPHHNQQCEQGMEIVLQASDTITVQHGTGGDEIGLNGERTNAGFGG